MDSFKALRMGSGLLSNQGEKSKNFCYNGSFKKKELKYGTPKPRDIDGSS